MRKYVMSNFFRLAKAQVSILFDKPVAPINFLDDFVKYPCSISNMRNGWYVTGGDDPMLLTTFDSSPSRYEDGQFKITLDNRTDPHVLYRGLMKYSHAQYRNVAISIILSPTKDLDAKFALWLKSFYLDVEEADAVELFNDEFRCNRRFTKATFTNHSGRNYDNDHTYNPSSLWVKTNTPYRFSLVRADGLLKWYLNNMCIKIEKDKTTTTLGVILDYYAHNMLEEGVHESAINYSNFAVYIK